MASKSQRSNAWQSYKQAQKKQSQYIVLSIVVLAACVALYAVFFSSPVTETAIVTKSDWTTWVETVNIALKVRENDRTKWAETGKTTLIEYLDFECEACKANYPLIKQLAQDYKDDLKIVVRYLPMPGHPNSSTAAYAAEAAGKQWKFWEMHDLLFETQEAWSHKEKADQSLFLPYAQQLNLDMEQFNKDVASAEVKERVKKSREEALQLWATGTPTFFLNGEKIQNPRSMQQFKILIDAEVLKDSQEPLGAKVHEHADFKVFIEGTEIDFGQDRYQSTTWKELNEALHLHDNNGNNIHKHRADKTIGKFFESLGVTFTKDCFEINSKKYCADWKKTLKFFVNDKENTAYADYEFSDLDRILISYGSESKEQIQGQLDAVTDMSCMYSAKCPERGKPPTENCVVGLGGDC